MEFFVHGTDTPINLDRFTVWFTDLDIGEEIQTNEGKTQPVETIVMKSPFETLRIAKGAKLSLVPAVSPTQTTGKSGPEPPDGITSVTATSEGDGSNNVEDWGASMQRSVGFDFLDKTSISFKYRIDGGGDGGRNFLMSTNANHFQPVCSKQQLREFTDLKCSFWDARCH